MSLFYERLPLSSEPNGPLTSKLLQRALIGEAYWNATLDAIPDHYAYKDAVHGYVLNMHHYANLDDDELSGFGLVLWGALGTGKTALGSIILMEAIRRGGRCLSFSYEDLVSRLWSKRAQWLPNGAPLQEGLENVNFLLLDDFVVSKHDAKNNAIEQVIRARYNRRLPTIISTNEDPKQHILEDRSLQSMVFHRWWIVKVEGVDWRKRCFE